MKLSEAAKQAEALYDSFLAEQDDFLDAHIDDLIDEEPEFDNEGYGHTSHWDEQSYSNYRYAQDEDGNWVHPYDVEY